MLACKITVGIITIFGNDLGKEYREQNDENVHFIDDDRLGVLVYPLYA